MFGRKLRTPLAPSTKLPQGLWLEYLLDLRHLLDEANYFARHHQVDVWGRWKVDIQYLLSLLFGRREDVGLLSSQNEGHLT